MLEQGRMKNKSRVLEQGRMLELLLIFKVKSENRAVCPKGMVHGQIQNILKYRAPFVMLCLRQPGWIRWMMDVDPPIHYQRNAFLRWKPPRKMKKRIVPATPAFSTSPGVVSGS